MAMSKANDDNNPSGTNYLAWLFISLVTVLMVNLILPFPVSFVVSLIIIISIMIIRADMRLKKSGVGGIRNWYKSISSSSESGRGWGTGYDSLYKPMTFTCMNCGDQHKKNACPKCGSKAVRAG
jgi:hypothetical protein